MTYKKKTLMEHARDFFDDPVGERYRKKEAEKKKLKEKERKKNGKRL